MERHCSSSLNTVLTQLVPEGSLVLDLGALGSGATQVLLKKKCRCYVEDLAEYLSALNATNQDPIAALDEHMLSTNSDVRFNVILCWDFLNYLSLDIISHLFKKLRPNIAPGCILHFIRYTGEKIAHTPRSFRLLKDFTFESLTDDNNARIPNQPHSTGRLLQHFDQFFLRDTVMNQQGMQRGVVEYLLQSKSGLTQPKTQDAQRRDVAPYFIEKSRQRTIELPALSRAMKILGQSDSLTVLDIGKNVRKEAQFHKRNFKNVYTEDVFSSISWQKKIHGDAGLNLSANLLGLAGCETLDLILAWDTFNYYRVDQIEGILRLLEKKLKRNTLIHLLLYRQKNIPGVPCVFEVGDDRATSVTGNSPVGESIPAIHAGVVSLVKHLRQFRIVENNNIKATDSSLCQELLLSYHC